MRHWFEQRQQVGALARLLMTPRPKHAPSVPGPVSTQHLAVPSRALVDAYVRFCGGDPAVYRTALPPHLFPHWSLPTWLAVARSLPYPPTKVVNLGCQVRFEAPLLPNAKLQVRGQLVELDDDGYRAKCVLRAETSQAEQRRLQADLRVLIPYRKKPRVPGRERFEPQRVPHTARELAYHRLSSSAGAQFAQLTGDVNPIHWSRSYARAVGFPSTILHGFASLGLAFEGLVRGLLSNDASGIAALDVRFERPLVLPAVAGVYLEGSRVYVADAPGSRSYVTGEVELKELLPERGHEE